MNIIHRAKCGSQSYQVRNKGEAICAIAEKYKTTSSASVVQLMEQWIRDVGEFLKLGYKGDNFSIVNIVPATIVSIERQMMVVVEGRRQRCWSCKQLRHISKFCPQKDPPEAPAAAAATVATETTATTVSTATIS